MGLVERFRLFRALRAATFLSSDRGSPPTCGYYETRRLAGLCDILALSVALLALSTARGTKSLRFQAGESEMDINYYLHREQVERMRADLARSDQARAIHIEMADLYRARVAAYRIGARLPPEVVLVATPTA